MNLLSKYVIPGSQGKVFSTDAVFEKDLKKIKTAILEISGVKDILFNKEFLPREFTVHAITLVKIKEIQNAVKKLRFHAIPKGFLTI
jgi:hypothetical protein